jgi:hypothetical protein
VNAIIARAQELYPDVRLYAYGFLSDHWHMLLASSCGQQLVQFVGYVKGRISTELGRLHGWPGSMWSSPARYTEVVDDAAIVARLVYIVSHGVKEGLVASPCDWPGASAVPGLLGDMRIAARLFDRDRETRARRRGIEKSFSRDVTVKLSPIPPWAELPADALRRRHRKIVEQIEKKAKGRRVLGVDRVLAVDPHDRARAPKRSIAPRCHASTHHARLEYDRQYRRGVDEYRAAAVAYRGGASLRDSGFPPGFFVNGFYCVGPDGELARFVRA